MTQITGFATLSSNIHNLKQELKENRNLFVESPEKFMRFQDRARDAQFEFEQVKKVSIGDTSTLPSIQRQLQSLFKKLNNVASSVDVTDQKPNLVALFQSHSSQEAMDLFNSCSLRNEVYEKLKQLKGKPLISSEQELQELFANALDCEKAEAIQCYYSSP